MKPCIFLTLGWLISLGSGYSIDRPSGNTDKLQPPPLTPYTPQVKSLPSSKTSRLGIVPSSVPQALVAQLELNGFPGVLVTKVVPNSPASKAGLQENDVIVKLGDFSLSGPQSVTEFLSEKEPGDKVTALFYRKGKQESVEITLDGETLSAEEILAGQGDTDTQLRISPAGKRNGGYSSGVASIRSMLPQRILSMQQMMDDFLNDSPMEDSQMDEIFNRMNLTPGATQILRSLRGLHQLPMPPMGKVSGGGQSLSSVRISDANGTIVVSSNSRTGTTVHVTDASGKILYSGPYNTQDEKSAVPDAVKERLKNIERNFCF